MDKSLEVNQLSANSDHKPNDELALAVLEGLSKNPKSLPSKLFYDDKGSELFKQIMELDEYYPTKCEAEILTKYKKEIIDIVADQEFNLIELGCGDGAKTILLIDELINNQKNFNFIPLDISKAAVDFLISNLKKKYSKIPFNINGIVAEYFQGLSWLNKSVANKNLILFLGSNIGNFDIPMALRFLRHLWLSLNKDDYVLIGFDLKKDLDVMYDAYNDKKGVTREFNFNVLDRINEVLQGNFNRKNFQHQGLYNVQTGAMESYLISLRRQKVRIKNLGKEFDFQPFEPLHMEYSYKYLETDIDYLASSTGFEVVKNFYDDKNYFVDSLWKVIK